MVTSADYLHVHPLRMQPRDGTEANEFSSSLPLDEMEPRLSKSPERELTCGWQPGTRYPMHGKETGLHWDSLKVRQSGPFAELLSRLQPSFRRREYASHSKTGHLGASIDSTVTAVLVGFSRPANFFHENSTK
jgi:hypothetical protein